MSRGNGGEQIFTEEILNVGETIRGRRCGKCAPISLRLTMRFEVIEITFSEDQQFGQA